MEKVIDQLGRNFPLGSTWAPEALTSGCREKVGSALYAPELKKDSLRKEREEKMFGALGPRGGGCLSHAGDVLWGQTVAWDGPVSVHRVKDGGDGVWIGVWTRSYVAVCLREVLPG